MIAGKNLVITGGTFNQSVSRTELSISFDKLAVKASPLAFHLADSDLSHSTCFTNTRTKILERMKSWALCNVERDKFVMWLYGPAGGGKTAIGRTMAKWCEEEGILLGEFFFSRADGTGAQLASLAPTLAYRMAVHTLTDAKEAISNAVSHDPHIFLAPLATQLKKLVLEPLNDHAPCNIIPYVIILDGLDETLSPDDQQLVIDVISETLCPLNSKLRIFICSRPEPTIVTAFNDPDSPLNAISTNISLNDDVDADADIRAFLVEKFAKTKKQVPYLPSGDWPTSANIDYLVAKSSGQFIFAATVEKYVCSPQHRHKAVERLKHVLDLRLLPHLEDKKKHPFADLDALYSLILRTRNDVAMSVKATAVCLEYPKIFNTVSPTDLAKVLHIELDETWAILYELASLFDASEHSIRPFHASFGDFLFDSSRSLDLFCTGGDIVADIICTMLRPHRDPEVLSYQAFSHLLGEATLRQDLRDTLSQMTPVSIFRRPASSKKYSRRSKGAYYLIPLLRQLESHVSSDVYENLVTYFDEQFAFFLPFGYWTSEIFHEAMVYSKGDIRSDGNKAKGDKGDMRTHVESDPESDNSIGPLLSASNSSESEDSDDFSDDDFSDDKRREMLKDRGPGSVSYRVSQLAPLTTSPAWDEINAQLNFRLTGPDSLKGFCNEAHFARSRLTKTSSALLNDSTQAQAALFCFKQTTDEDITEDLRIGFAKLLPHSLSHSKRLPELTTAIQTLPTRFHALCQRLPPETMKAITDYLDPPSGSQKPRTAAGVVPEASPTHRRPPGTVPKSSTQAITSQKPSTTLNASTARRTVQKSSPASQPPSTANSNYRTPSQPQPVPPTFQVPSHSTQTQPSPSTSQQASKASRPPQKAPTTSQPPSTGLKSSTAPQPQVAPRTSQPPTRTQPSPNIAQEPLTVSQTPEQPDASQSATIPDSESSTTQGPSTSGATLGPSHPSKALTSAQAPSDSSQHPQGPSRLQKRKKGPWK